MISGDNSHGLTHDNIPSALRARPQWVTWRYERRDGKETKVLYRIDGKRAKSNDPATWTTYENATAALNNGGGFAGVGYVFAADDPFVGVDLDGCRDAATGEIAKWAQDILDAMTTYGEISPSQTGVKLWAIGKWPFERGKKIQLPDEPQVADKLAGIEVYDHVRFFCVTGQRIDGVPSQPQERQAQIDAIAQRFFSTPKKTKAAPIESNGQHGGVKIIERARKYLAKMPAGVAGQSGHDRTYAAACALCVGFDLARGEALVLLREFNDRCEPPWSEFELAHKIDSAMQADGERGHLLRKERPKHIENYDMQVRGGGLPEVQLPGGDVTISASAQRFGELLGTTGRFYERGGVPVRLLESNGAPRLEVIRPAAFCSDIESVARVIGEKQTKQGPVLAPSTCSEAAGKLLLASAALRTVLPPIKVLSACPVLIERNGELVTVNDYDLESGILAGGEAAPEMGLVESLELLNEVVGGFRFASAGDRARARRC